MEKKMINFISFIIYPLHWDNHRNEVKMINFNNKKNKQIFSAIIIIILVLAMVVPMVASALLY